MFNKMKTLGLAAVVSVALPVSAFAATISGQIDITGAVNLPTSSFDAAGNADLEPTGLVVVSTGDFSGIAFGTPVAMADISFAAPGQIWSVGGFTFNASLFSNFQDSATKAFNAVGTIAAAGFDDTRFFMTFTSQTNGPAVQVSFSSTSLPSPVPVPASGLLLVGGLGALGVARRRKKTA
jgi:hypothetical protein